MQANFALNQTITNSTGINAGITATADGDTLTLQEGIYNKSTDRGITINKNITIQGNGSPDKVILDAEGLSRIFTIGSGVKVVFINLTLIDGYSTVSGGAIYNSNAGSTINIINCTFENNSAGNNGGAIYNNGNFSVIVNSMSGNSVTGHGSMIYNKC